MKSSHVILFTAAVALALSGCATTNKERGATIGAITGAVIGKSTSNHKDKRAIFGAAIGAIAGAAIGDYMDQQEQEFRRELSGSGVDVVREGNSLRLIMPSNITFASGQSYITSGFHHTLDDIARILTKYERTRLSIEGHTDSVGTMHYNQYLSEQRAYSVKRYLVHQDIIPRRLEVNGYGETQAIASNKTKQGRALNRRVEIQIMPNRS